MRTTLRGVEAGNQAFGCRAAKVLEPDSAELAANRRATEDELWEAWNARKSTPGA